MGFLEKLFGLDQVKNPNAKIHQLFKYNLQNVYIDFTFKKVKEETISTKKTILVETFQKKLDYKECNLFSLVELKNRYNIENEIRSVEPEKINSIVFCSENLSDIAVDDLATFINSIYQYYEGPDTFNEGMFTSEEKDLFLSSKYFPGRWWQWKDYPRKLDIRIETNTTRLEAEISLGLQDKF
ncbi:MAG: hypothetical protein JO072_07300 [Parafilimonas sp.]|nr:hypothetical protein [Parafilimonas sp.]